MRSAVAFLSAVTVAVAAALSALVWPMASSFESATDHGLAQKIGDFVLTTGIMYALLWWLVCVAAIAPFAIVLRIMKRWMPDVVAALTAAAAAAAAALVPIAKLYQAFFTDDVTFAESFRAALPGTIACGILGGLVYAGVRRDWRARAS